VTRILYKKIDSCGDCPDCEWQGRNTNDMDNGYYCKNKSLGYSKLILSNNEINHGDGHIDFILPDWCPLEKKGE